MTIPLIDFSSDQNPSAAINNALKDIGFMMVKNIGVDQHLLSKVYAASKGFFNCSIEDKNKYRYRSALENFGYQGLNEENRNAGHQKILERLWSNFLRMFLTPGFLYNAASRRRLSSQKIFLLNCTAAKIALYGYFIILTQVSID